MPLYEINTPGQDYLDIVSKSFQATKAEFCELNIEAWAQINKRGLSLQELDLLYRDIAHKLLIEKRYPKLEEYEDFLSINNQGMIAENVYVELSLQSFQSDGLESGTFLGIQIIANDLENSRKYYDLVKEIFTALNTKTQVGITLVSTFPGQLPEDEMYEKTAIAFAAPKAQVVEGINTEKILSFSGYTPLCKEYLPVDDKKINLNVALRYHALDDKTYLHIGAPLIFQEY